MSQVTFVIRSRNTLRDVCKKIADARDWYAQHGEYPRELGDRCFDDWAADLCSEALKDTEWPGNTNA